MSLKIIIIILLAVWLLCQSSTKNNVEEMTQWTYATSPNEDQFILKNSDGPRTLVQKEKEKEKINMINIPFPNETNRSDICNNQVCGSCDCYNPILMNMCKECPQKIDPCDCDDC